MFNSQSRRRGNTGSSFSTGTLSVGSGSYFTPINRISSTVVQYASTIETIPLATIQKVDCTSIVNEYNLIKSELNELKKLFSDPNTNISAVLSGLQQ